MSTAKKEIKASKPELESILKFAKRNPQQLCDILPDGVVATRKLRSWTGQQEKKRKSLAASERGLVMRDNDVQVKTARFRVEMKELRLKEATLDKDLYSEEEMRKGIIKATLNLVKQTLFEKENTGDAQSFNARLSKKWADVEAANGIAPPAESAQMPEPQTENK